MKSEGEPGRRHHDRALKARLVELSLQPGASASAIAREHGINANLLFTWRREFRRAETSAVLAPTNGMDAPTRNGIDVPKWKR